MDKGGQKAFYSRLLVRTGYRIVDGSIYENQNSISCLLALWRAERS